MNTARCDARRLRSAAVLAALLACAACKHGEITVLEPAAKPPGPLAITFVPDGEDAAAAAALGWTAGIPGAEVIIAPSVKPRAWGAGDTATGPPIDTLLTDSAGRVSIPDLPEGWYYVEVQRWLTDTERTRLAPGTALIGFMTQQTVDRGSVTLSVPGSHRRSLVISEVSNFAEWDPVTLANGNYTTGGYLELANNADTTVYLDGLVIALFTASIERPPQTSRCPGYKQYDDDPDGIWVEYMDSLPGTGHDYPLAPGAVALIATDAINHQAIMPAQGLDLSHANFESVGTGDADNPGVPNTVHLPIGTNGVWTRQYGMIFSVELLSAVVLSLPVDTASLPKASKYGSDNGWVLRLPRDHILDMLGAFWPDLVAVWDDLCPSFVNRAFDRQPAPLWWSYLPDGTWHDLGEYSIQRKVAYTRSDGRKILQDTRSTEADFYVGLRTPFALPSGPP
jgi:hypothetical protein